MKIKTLFLLSLALPLAQGCGSDAKLVAEDGASEEAPAGDTPPETPTGETAAKISYSQMQQYLNIYCQRCHTADSFMQSERNLRASSTKTRIANGSMPTPGAKPLPSNIKTDMINFF